MPIPSFALAKMMSFSSQPINSISCWVTSCVWALGKSTLLMIGTMLKLLSMARYVLLTVCASIPWAASTSNNAPSQAANERDTS